MEDKPTIESLMRELERRQPIKDAESRRARRKKRVAWSLGTKAFAVLAVIAVAGMALAAVVLFTNTAPTVNVPAQVVSSACTTLYAYQVNGVQGSPTYALFSCVGGVALTGAGGQATASSVSLGGWNAVYVYTNASGPGTNCGSATQIATGSTFTFAASTGYNYCALATAPGSSVSGFSVTWSQ